MSLTFSLLPAVCECRYGYTDPGAVYMWAEFDGDAVCSRESLSARLCVSAHRPGYQGLRRMGTCTPLCLRNCRSVYLHNIQLFRDYFYLHKVNLAVAVCTDLCCSKQLNLTAALCRLVWISVLSGIAFLHTHWVFCFWWAFHRHNYFYIVQTILYALTFTPNTYKLFSSWGQKCPLKVKNYWYYYRSPRCRIYQNTHTWQNNSGLVCPLSDSVL